MSRTKTVKNKDVRERTNPGNNGNSPTTVEVIKSIFIEMFKKEKTLTETVKSAYILINKRIETLAVEITKSNKKLINLSNEVSEVQLSIDISQETMEEKLKKQEERFTKGKKENTES